MENKYEKNIHGVDWLIEMYYNNGQLHLRYEWNASRTATFIVEQYDESGKLTEKRIWNEDRTETFKVTN
jgi:antitoxin component YwqK of YwqJK toxin-antitoxin module